MTFSKGGTLYSKAMARGILTAATLFSWLLSSAQQELSLSQFKRILFVGNSITYEGTYVTDIEAVLRLNHPAQEMEVMNLGLPSETVSGLSEPGHADDKFPRPNLHERLQRVIALTRPNIVVACYGINDGIYMPFDGTRFEAFKSGMRRLHEKIIASGATVVHVTPPYFDELRGHKEGYENTMDKYAAWVMSMKDSGWNVIDIYNPMKQYLHALRTVDRQYHLDGTELAPDGIHPNPNAHWLMARTIVDVMGEENVAEAVSIDSFVSPFKNGSRILELIRKKQLLMKDALLSAAGHKRPGMKAGLSIKEARKKEKQFDEEINRLNKRHPND